MSRKRKWLTAIAIIFIEVGIRKLVPDTWGLDGSIAFFAGMLVGTFFYKSTTEGDRRP